MTGKELAAIENYYRGFRIKTITEDVDILIAEVRRLESVNKNLIAAARFAIPFMPVLFDARGAWNRLKTAILDAEKEAPE